MSNVKCQVSTRKQEGFVSFSGPNISIKNELFFHFPFFAGVIIGFPSCSEISLPK